METRLLIAWNELQLGLKNYVYQKVKDRATADDIVQDVFIKAQSRLNQLRDSEKISAWIYQIARHTIADHFRRQSKSIQPSDLDWDSSEYSLNDCVAYCLGKLIITLPDKYREALELTELKNFSQHDLSVQLHISHSGARSRVQRARKLLKDKLETLFRIETDTYGNVITCENRNPCCCSSAGSTVEEQRC
jgi:RNA polymerase sigma-70 factor (ECF subfamily)